MNNYFLSTIKYEKTAEEGKIVKVSEQHLVDALSFTEAEARIVEEMKPFISGDFVVDKLSRYKVNEIFEGTGDKFYLCKVNFITLDEEKGIEKKSPVRILVQSNNLKEAREGLELGKKESMADYDNASISETKIIDIL